MFEYINNGAIIVIPLVGKHGSLVELGQQPVPDAVGGKCHCLNCVWRHLTALYGSWICQHSPFLRRAWLFAWAGTANLPLPAQGARVM